MEQFGVMNTIIAIAEKYNYKFEEVLELEYSTVYIIMYRDKISSAIQKRYYDILNPKRKGIKDGKY